MKYGKKILTVLIVTAMITAVIGGVIYGVQRTSGTTVTVYRASELNYGSYMSSESTMEGYITADAAQNVYSSDTLVVKEVVVTEGQEVVVGDVLLTYDTDKTKLNLEKAILTEETIRLQLDVANRNLAILGSLSPVSTDESEEEEYYIDEDPGGEYIDPGEEDDDREEEEPPYKDAVCYDVLDENSIPYNIEDFIIIEKEDLDPELIAGMTDEEVEAYIDELIEAIGPQLGTERNPYRFLCTNGAVIEPSFIHYMKTRASENDGPFYIQLEVREGDTVDGALIEAWEMDASRFIKVDKDWSAKVIVDNYIVTPSPTPTVTPTVTPVPSVSVTPTPGVSTTVTPTPAVTGEEPDPTESVTETPTVTAELSPTEIPDDAGDATETPTDSSDTSDVTGTPVDPGTSDPEEPDSGDNSQDDSTPVPPATDSSGDDLTGRAPEAYEGAYSNGNGSGITFAKADLTTKYLLTAVDTDSAVTSSDSKAAKNSQIASALGLIPSDAQMTAEEIREAKKQETQTIKSLKLDLREALLKIEAAEKSVEEGTAKAKMNGVVKTVTDPAAAKAQGTPVVQVTAAEGLFVKSALPENLYGTVKDGDFVSIMSWTSGQTFSGRVRDISFYPDTSGMFGYANTTTYYPMTIYVSEQSEALNDGEWVQVTVNGTGEQTFDRDTNDLYLYRAFIRDDSEGRYVLKRGSDGTLVKQYVETGELIGEGYEILSGVTVDDWVAFPYGKNLSEGSETREGTIDEFYSS